MTALDRREFINKLAVSLAGGLSGVVAQSCTTVRGAGYLGGKGRVRDPGEVLARLDSNTRALRRSATLRRAAHIYRSSGCNTALLPDALETLLVAGMVGDLGEKERMDPRVQKRVREALPVMTDAFMGMATFMENQSPEERKALQQTLREEPEILTEFQARFDAASREHGVPEERLEHLHSVFNQCVWRLKNQDPLTIIDECVGLVDKAAQHHSITPQMRRSWAASGGYTGRDYIHEGHPELDEYVQLASLENTRDTTVEVDADQRIQTQSPGRRNWLGVDAHPARRVRSDRSRTDPAIVDEADRYPRREEDIQRHRSLMGAALMGLGAVLETMGWVGGIATNGNLFFVLFGCVGGAVCLIVGLVMLITGAARLRRIKRETRRPEQ